MEAGLSLSPPCGPAKLLSLDGPRGPTAPQTSLCGWGSGDRSMPVTSLHVALCRTLAQKSVSETEPGLLFSQKQWLRGIKARSVLLSFPPCCNPKPHSFLGDGLAPATSFPVVKENCCSRLLGQSCVPCQAGGQSGTNFWSRARRCRRE